MRILLINGPNLNMLGTREPDKYGTQTLADIEQDLKTLCQQLDIELDCFQANAEHEIINRIHRVSDQPVDVIIINPAAYTHTSIAIRDAILSVNVPFYEVHLSNIHQREPYRHHSYFSDIAVGVICGLGSSGYEAAVRSAKANFTNQN